jgi:hypothetical protein
VDDRQRQLRELWGIRLVLVALVLGLVWSLMYFPIWSNDGSSMLILLGYVTVQPVQFVLERVGPGGAIVWLVGACLIESRRVDLTSLDGGRWNRERLAILFAVGAEAIFLGSFGSLGILWTAWYLVRVATGITVLIAISLYLLWTAERLAGIPMGRLGAVAFAVALVAGTLDLLSLGVLFRVTGPPSGLGPPASVAGALLRTASLAIWILIFSLIVRRGRIDTPEGALMSGA